MAERKLGRVIGVRFPDGHLIWTYPEGQRANQVRELVDLALAGRINIPYVGEFIKELKEIKNQLATIREDLSRLEERLDTIEAVSPKRPEPPSQVRIDTAAFMDL
jgi:seryl-tRNA synthetase